MAKKCMKCGGSTTPKMAKGGMPTKVLGPAKKPFAAGIPFFTGAGQTGPEYMKKGGMIKKKYQAGGKVNYMPSKAAYDKSIRDMGGPDNPPVQLEPREIYKAKMDQKKRSVVNKMYPTTGIPKQGVGAKMQNGGTTPKSPNTGKITVNSRPVPKSKYTTPSRKPMMAKKGGLVKKQLGGPATSNNPNPTKTLENAAMFIGGGLATALAARKQNQPMTQKKKEKVLAKQQKQATRKKK